MILRNKTWFDRLLAVCMFVLSGAALAATPVGEVSLVIGAARVVGETGNSAAVQRGLPVFPGDRIETEDGGHVHLRFVDGAFVSVRPGSRLRIETYRYDPANPQDSAIRFQLEQGVARSITGKGGEAARDRFRLNTPIAAIGVKGTDFVVRAEADSVRVAVQTGAIVLAPLGANCPADALGPCAGEAARILSADMGRVMLEFQRQQGVPRIVPINGHVASDQARPAADENHAAPRRAEASMETLAAEAVVKRGEITNSNPNPRPGTGPGQPELPPATLIWGRWLWAGALPGDTLTTAYSDAYRNGENEPVSGNLNSAVLFRPAGSAADVLPTNLGQVSFAMRDSQVHFVKDGAASLGQVKDGWFKVDFGARTFATGLAVNHAATGNVDIAASGTVSSKGVFNYRDANTYLGGALAMDGSEAAYHFQRDIAGGSLLGLTRWAK